MLLAYYPQSFITHIAAGEKTMSQSDGVLQIIFCPIGYHLDPPLKFVVREVMRDSEIKILDKQFRDYRLRGFRMLDGFTATQLHGNVTLEIKPRPYRPRIAKSPRAVNELAQMIADCIGVSDFKLHDSSRKCEREATFTRYPGFWTQETPEPILAATPQAA